MGVVHGDGQRAGGRNLPPARSASSLALIKASTGVLRSTAGPRELRGRVPPRGPRPRCGRAVGSRRHPARRCRSFAIDRFDELFAEHGPSRPKRVSCAGSSRPGLVGDEAVALQPPGKPSASPTARCARPGSNWKSTPSFGPEHDPEVTVLRFPGTVRVEQFDERRRFADTVR